MNPPSANTCVFCSSASGSSSPAWSTIFSVVAIASLKMTQVYEAGGTIEINKPDASLNFQNSATFSLDYYDPTELETEVKILQSDLLATASHPRTESRSAAGIRWSEHASIAHVHRPCSRPAIAIDPTRASSLVGGFKGNLKVALSPNTRIIEVHYRSSDPTDGRDGRQYPDADLRREQFQGPF